ncbi:MAG: Ltp family lipoprotein [Paeniclostridium sp.]
MCVDNVDADWKGNVLKAQDYNDTMYVEKGLYKQLTSSYGENFTKTSTIQ